jgi:Zn-dependent metalloprotease
VLEELSAPLRLSASREDLVLMQSKKISMGSFARFKQYIEGIPVRSAEVLVHIDSSGNLRHIISNHQVRSASLVVPKTTKISESQAEKIMRDAVKEPFILRTKRKLRVDKIFFPTTRGLTLAWEVVANTQKPAHDWHVFVDAEDGEVLAMEDHIMTVDGQGLAFNPNPVVTMNDNTIREGVTPEATLNGECDSVQLVNIAGPVGGNYTLTGDYCNITNLGDPNIGIPSEGISTDFNYDRTADNFEAVNVYYHIDTIQRFIQSTLDIDDANNRRIDADPHDNSINAAWYSSDTKDLHFSDSGPTQPDRGEDSDCMAHEYGHAIQDNMVPGWGDPVPATTRYESRAIGEGFGDMMAVLYNILHGNGYQRQVMEDWVFVHQDLGDGLRGLRRVDHDKLYTAFTNGFDFYGNSEIWSGALWNIFLAMGGDSAIVADWEEPRNILMKAMIASNRLLGTAASMPEAAEALMNMHEELEDQCGRHLIPMVDEFHDRQILVCQAGSDIRILKLWSQQSNAAVGSYENVEYGQDNWFYAEIKNQGAVEARSVVVTFSFKSPFSTPVYPVDFRNNIISAAAEFELAAGETRTICARWPKEYIPGIPAGQETLHGCILAEIYNPVDHVAAGSTTIGASNGKLKQCNTTIVDLLPDEPADFHFTISNFYAPHPEPIRLEVIRPGKWPNLPVSFSHINPGVVEELFGEAREYERRQLAVREITMTAKPSIRFVESTSIEIEGAASGEQIRLNVAPDSTISFGQVAVVPHLSLRDDFVRCDAMLTATEQAKSLVLKPGIRAGFVYTMRPHQRKTLVARLKVPANAVPGEEFRVEFIQRNAKGEFVGGFDVQVRVGEKKVAPGKIKKRALKVPSTARKAKPAKKRAAEKRA